MLTGHGLENSPAHETDRPFRVKSTPAMESSRKGLSAEAGLKRVHLIVPILVAAFIAILMFVPVMSEPITLCDHVYLICGTADGYASLTYHFLGFGAVLIGHSYLFWTTK
jgi:hypothetical protein